MNALELTSVINTLANAIACNLTSDELSLAAALFTQLGDTMAVISIQKDLQKQACADKSEKAVTNTTAT